MIGPLLPHAVYAGSDSFTVGASRSGSWVFESDESDWLNGDPPMNGSYSWQSGIDISSGNRREWMSIISR